MVAINKLTITSTLALGSLASHVVIQPYRGPDCVGPALGKDFRAAEGNCCKPGKFQSFKLGPPEGDVEYKRLVDHDCRVFFYDRADCKATDPDAYYGPGLTNYARWSCFNVNFTRQHLTERPARGIRLHCDKALSSAPVVIPVVAPTTSATRTLHTTVYDLDVIGTINIPVTTTVSAPTKTTSCTAKKVSDTTTVDTTTTIWMVPTGTVDRSNETPRPLPASDLAAGNSLVRRQVITVTPPPPGSTSYLTTWSWVDNTVGCRGIEPYDGCGTFHETPSTPTITASGVACYERILGEYVSTTCAPAQPTA